MPTVVLAVLTGCRGCTDNTHCFDPLYTPVGPQVASAEDCPTPADTVGAGADTGEDCAFLCEREMCAGDDDTLYCEPCNRVGRWINENCTGGCLDSGMPGVIRVRCFYP